MRYVRNHCNTTPLMP